MPGLYAWSVETGSPEETEALAAELAARLRPGDVVTVSGVRGARRARAGDEPDVHDRPPLPRRARRSVAPRPLSFRGRVAGGVGRSRAVFRQRDRVRRVAGGRRRRAPGAALCGAPASC